MASEKIEYGARTIRTKINKLLPTYLTEFPSISSFQNPTHHPYPSKNDWTDIQQSLEVDHIQPPVTWAVHSIYVYVCIVIHLYLLLLAYIYK